MLGGLAVLFVGVHIAALLVDSFVTFDVVDVLVPFASWWSPAAVAAGIIAFWMLAAVEITSLLRNRIPNRVWRRVHMLSFAVFVLASAHFIAAGTDAASPVVIISLLALISTVVGLTVIRVAELVAPGGPPRPQPAAAPAVSPAVTPAVAWTTPPPPPRRPRALAPTRRERGRLSSAQSIADSIAETSSGASGSTCGAKRAIVVPSSATRNFSKFQRMSPL